MKYVVVYDYGSSVEWASSPQDTPQEAIALSGKVCLANAIYSLKDAKAIAKVSDLGWVAELNDDEVR